MTLNLNLVKAIKMDTIMIGNFVAMEDAGAGYVLVASIDNVIRLFSTDSCEYLSNVHSPNAECTYINNIKVYKDKMVLGGKGKITLITLDSDNKAKLEFVSTDLGIGEVKAILFGSENDIICIDESYLYGIYIYDNKYIEINYKLSYEIGHLTGIIELRPNGYMVVDDNSSISLIRYEEDVWIDTMPLFSFEKQKMLYPHRLEMLNGNVLTIDIY